MKKFFFSCGIAIVLIALMAFIACSQDPEVEIREVQVEVQDPTLFNFWLVHEPFPDFFRTTKMIVDAGPGKTFKSSEIDKDTFKVYMTHSPYNDGRLRDSADRFSGWREVTGTYVINDISQQNAILNPSKVDNGRYLVLELFSERSTTYAPGADAHNPSENYARAPGARMSETMLRNGLEIDYYPTGGPHMPLRLNYTLSQVKEFNRYKGTTAEKITPNSGFAYALSTKMFTENDILPGYITTYVNLYKKIWYWPTSDTKWNWKDGVPANYPPASYHEFIGYRLYVPAKTTEKQALVVFMHGTGERNAFGKSIPGYIKGWDNIGGEPPPFVQTVGHVLNGQMASSWIKAMNESVIPQAYVALFQSNDTWDDENQLNVIAAIEDMVADPAYNIDPKRIYIGGLSMGGAGSWNMIKKRPELFAAWVGYPGGGVETDENGYDEFTQARTGTSDDVNAAGEDDGISGMPMWLISVNQDTVRSRRTFNEIKAAGGNIRWSWYPTLDDVTPHAYGDPHMAAWAQFFLNAPKTDDAYIVIDSDTVPDPQDATTTTNTRLGPTGKNPRDDAGDTIFQWLFKQHL